MTSFESPIQLIAHAWTQIAARRLARIDELEAALRGLLGAWDVTQGKRLLIEQGGDGPFCVCCAVYQDGGGEDDHDEACPVGIAWRALEGE